MNRRQHAVEVRVRYSETDKMGTYYNSRALEWFEQGRAELLRHMGKPYREMERLGLMLPVSEAYVRYLGRAEYDDRLQIVSTLSMPGRARLRFDVEVQQADSGRPVCAGYTVHAVTDLSGRPMRPPEWLVELLRPDGEPV